MTEALPIIDVGAFLEKRASGAATAREIEKACREFGFFYATGHGVGGETVHALGTKSRPEIEQFDVFHCLSCNTVIDYSGSTREAAQQRRVRTTLSR